MFGEYLDHLNVVQKEDMEKSKKAEHEDTTP